MERQKQQRCRIISLIYKRVGVLTLVMNYNYDDKLKNPVATLLLAKEDYYKPQAMLT